MIVTEKYAKKLLGEKEIESVLQRLDNWTTVAQTLDVVYSLVDNMVVMEGAHLLFVRTSMRYKALVCRWQAIDR